MMNTYFELYYNNEMSGTVRVEKVGVYYNITGKFYPPSEGFYRLYANDGDVCYDLGLGVPKEDHFEFTSKLQSRLIEDRSLYFFVKQGFNRDLFAIVQSDKPFFYLHKLEDAYLDISSGVYGVRIKD